MPTTRLRASKQAKTADPAPDATPPDGVTQSTPKPKAKAKPKPQPKPQTKAKAGPTPKATQKKPQKNTPAPKSKQALSQERVEDSSSELSDVPISDEDEDQFQPQPKAIRKKPQKNTPPSKAQVAPKSKRLPHEITEEEQVRWRETCKKNGWDELTDDSLSDLPPDEDDGDGDDARFSSIRTDPEFLNNQLSDEILQDIDHGPSTRRSSPGPRQTTVSPPPQQLSPELPTRGKKGKSKSKSVPPTTDDTAPSSTTAIEPSPVPAPTSAVPSKRKDPPTATSTAPPPAKKSKKVKQNKSKIIKAPAYVNENRTQAIAAAKQAFPSGIRVIEKNIYSNAPAVAGYLGCADTDELQRLLQAVDKPLKELDALKQKGWGVVNMTSHSQVQSKKIFQYLSDQDSERVHELTGVTSIHPDDPAFRNWAQEKQEIMHAYVAATLFLMVVLLKQGVPTDSGTTSPIKMTTKDPKHWPQYHGYSAEDLHRAYTIWRYKVTLGDKNFPRNTAAMQVRYMEDHECDGRSPDQNQDSIQTTVSTDPGFQHFAQEQAEQRIKDRDYLDSLFDQLHAEHEDDQTDDFDKIDEAVQATFMVQFSSKQLVSGSKAKTQRPPMSLDDQRRFLELMHKMAGARHDAFRQVAVSGSTTAMIAGLNNAQLVEGVSAVGSYMKKDIDFWELRKRMSTVSASAPSYEESCRELGITPCTPDQQTPPFEHSILIPNVWQIMGVVWAMRMERSGLGAATISDDCGTGKTIQGLMLVDQQAQKLRREYDANPDGDHDFRPTLVVVPNNIIQVWYEDWKKYFKGRLIYKEWYGDGAKADLDRKQHVLPTDPADLVAYIKKRFPRNKPDSAKVVIVTSYGTLYNRSLGQQSRAQANAEILKSQEMKDNRDPHYQEYKDRENAAEFDHYAKDQGDDKDVSLDDENIVYFNYLQHLFIRIICDEGHKAKNTRTMIHRAIQTCYAAFVWWFTATPMINRVSDLLGLLTMAFNPRWRVETPDPLESAYDTDAEFTPLFDMTPEDYLTMTGNFRSYMLDPLIFCKLCNQDKLIGSVAKKALNAILGRIQLRRTMATRVDVCGVTISIGEKIPSYSAAFVELEMDRYERQFYDKMWSQTRIQLTKPHSGKGGKTDAHLHNKGMRNQAAHRRASLASFNVRFDKYLDTVPKNKTTAQQVMDRFYTDWLDGGASYFYEMTCLDPKIGAPLERWSMAFYICSYSPKLRYLCSLMLEGLYSSDPYMRGKTLIFVRWPLEAWLIAALFSVLGIKFICYRSGMTSEEKALAATQFNDPSHDAVAMIASSASSPYGLNLQGACHRMVNMSSCDNINTLTQCIGRIHRYGQMYKQFVWNLGMDRSYDQYLQGKMTEKFNHQVVGEANLSTMSEEEIQAERQLLETQGLPEEQIDARIKRLQDIHLTEGADNYIQQLLGFRCSRQNWDDPGLPSRLESDDPEVSKPEIRERAPLVPFGEIPDLTGLPPPQLPHASLPVVSEPKDVPMGGTDDPVVPEADDDKNDNVIGSSQITVQPNQQDPTGEEFQQREARDLKVMKHSKSLVQLGNVVNAVAGNWSEPMNGDDDSQPQQSGGEFPINNVGNEDQVNDGIE